MAYGDGVRGLIKAIKDGASKGLENIGNYGVIVLQGEFPIHSIDTGRLYYSFSWATDTKKSNNPQIFDSREDRVKCEEPNTVCIGSNVPYAPHVAFGYAGREILPENRRALLNNLVAWCERHGFEYPEKSAKTIYKNLIENGHAAIPFWETSVIEIRTNAMKMLQKTIIDAINEVQSNSTEVEI
jgi:NADPH-dependent 7-cyano-7-deazaguanine reductase QueF